MRGVPDHVVANVEVEVAVVVEVGKRRRGRMVAAARQARALRDVLEGSIALVAVERIGHEPADEEIGPAVVVVVPHGHAMAVSLTPRDPGDAGFLGDVFKCAVAPVPKEPIAGGRWCGSRAAGRVGERSSLHAIDVEPAVAVEVDQAHSSRHRLGEQVLHGVAALELKAEAGRLGVVDEIRHGLVRFGRPSPMAAEASRLVLCRASVAGRRSARRSLSIGPAFATCSPTIP